MDTRLRSTILILSLLALSTGCASVELRRRTNSQASTVTNLYHQQVLDNLAMFSANPNSTPFFSLATGGTVAVNGTLTSNLNLTWNATTITSELLGLTGQKNYNNNWSLQPINNPDKLNLMRCAYQQAVGRTLTTSQSCPDCCKLAQQWHGAKSVVVADVSTNDSSSESSSKVGEEELPSSDPLAPAHRDTPIQSCKIPCLPDTGWFCVGCKKHVPKDECCLVGEYCGTYVWVPAEHADELHRLTMIILDYATGAQRTQTVKRDWEWNGTEYVLKTVETTTTELDSQLPAGRAIEPIRGVQENEYEETIHVMTDQGMRTETRTVETPDPPMPLRPREPTPTIDRGLFFLSPQPTP